MSAGRRESLLAPVLVLTTLVASIISSLGAPLIPTIARNLHAPVSTAQWSLTVALLAGAVSAPVMGRLGDGPRQRETILGGLAVVGIGGIIAATAPGLDLLLVGRALQGVGLGLIPLTMAAAREHLPAHRVAPSIAVLSVSAAAGIGAGYPISGFLADSLGLAGAFGFGAVFAAITFLCVAIILPSSAGRAPAKLDPIGVVLLTAGLVALLLAVAQGNAWGWHSAAVLGLLVAAVAIMGAWALQQLRASSPVVELRLLRHPAVLAGDVCATVLGMAMYMNLSGVTEFVQAPRSSGFGFGASAVEAGLCLVPLSILSVLMARALPTLTVLLGPRLLLALGSLVTASGSAFFALFHSALWEAFVMMGVLGLGLGSTFAAIPWLLVRAIPPEETGSALGFYQVVRYVGFSLGSALTAALLAGHTAAGHAQPAEGGYSAVLWGAALVCAASATLALALPRGREQSAEDGQPEQRPLVAVGSTR